MIVRTYLNIPDSEARMMEARTQTGRGSNSGPRERMTASSARLDTRPVSRDLQPDLSCTRDLESEAEATGTWRGHRWSGDTATWGWCGGGRGPRPSSPSEARPWRRPGQNTTSSGQTRTR